jgi:hypothetical protein
MSCHEDDRLPDLAVQASELRLQPVSRDRVEVPRTARPSGGLRGQRRARARPTRCRCPPEGATGNASHRRIEPDQLEQLDRPIALAPPIPAEETRHRCNVLA